MGYWATQGDLVFDEMSLDDFFAQSNDLDGYCLYLDEYVGYVEYVLLRNLARAIELRCIVCNTNSDISNLLGRNQAQLSRESGEHVVWSMVVADLGNISSHVFTRVYSETLNAFRDAMVGQCENPREFGEFLNIFRTHPQLMRPGVFKYFVEALNAFASQLQGNFHFSAFLDFVINAMGILIVERKKSIKTTLEGRLANLCLILGNGYADLSDSIYLHESAFSNGKLFLKNHLYRLINPVNPAEWLFITFPVYTDVIETDNVDEYLEIYSRGSRREWNQSITQFQESELLTSLACTSVPLSRSIAKCMADGRLQSRVGIIDLGAVANPLATKRDGNYLEVFTTISLIDASRHLFNSEKVTFNGVNGLDFIKSFIQNMVDGIRNPIARNSLEISFPRESEQVFDLERFFQESQVPYLMPSGRKVPSLLQSLSRDGAINVGECSRLPDLTELDIGFSLGIGSSDLLTSRPNRAAVHDSVAECKNWESAVDTTTLKNIITKAFKYGAKLCFISCLKVSNPSQSLRSFCAPKMVNLYKLERDATGNVFKVVPFPNTNVYLRPKMICLVFEISIIHPNSFLAKSIMVKPNKDEKPASKVKSRRKPKKALKPLEITKRLVRPQRAVNKVK